MLKFHFFLPVLFLIFVSSEVMAGYPGYARPSRRELASTVLGFEGLDLNNDDVIREYAQLTYCNLYQRTHQNDFEWLETSNKIREGIQGKGRDFRRHYELIAPLEVERYDFDLQAFPISEDHILDKVGVLALLSLNTVDDKCIDYVDTVYFPPTYTVTLKDPLTLTRVYVAPERGEEYLRRAGGGKKRIVFLRVRLQLFSFRSFSGSKFSSMANFYGEIQQVDYFEDPNLTIYLAPGPRF